ncbi:carbamoyltransferase HypF [Klebsiella pneumoniae]|uniref:carbamoyltransferase HypF n=1 Tax=Klebsiella pneumoniae TaxID=573 RepID=UPI0028F78DBD|nr:carbamoyltransferase HypF [Klebsiella pneumoniae]MDT9971082.1 carbamoyltransferase HypF [Klebsiella pneumoniae]
MNGVQIRIRGKVQGVGFRPFVWQLARAQARCGDVCNDGDGVLVRLVGGDDGFTAALADHCPPLARIDSTACIPYRWAATPQDFTIRESGAGRMRTQIVPDAATCPACLAEMNDPRARRYRYPFINCTHCGPRLTIIRAMPYDRPFTAMAPFPLCSPCEAEFRDPADRRFHAQPVACPDCGPRLEWRAEGEALDGEAALQAAIARLAAGDIVAIKGIGGFHLACDAGNPAAVAMLRAGLGDIPPLLALGADMKNTFCLARGSEAVLSQHFGDLGEEGVEQQWRSALQLMQSIYAFVPQRVVVDAHPGYRSTQWAASLPLPLETVLHHHAHAAACLAEHRWPLDGGDVIALTLDGIGMGENGALWGGECLRVNYRECEHLGGLPAVALPGGDLAARQPWRNLLAHCLAFVPDWQDYPQAATLRQRNWPLLAQAIERGINAPRASSCGRLFDAVACALDCAPESLSYEGEAACRLEALAASCPGVSHPVTLPLRDDALDLATFWRQWLSWQATPAQKAWAFHDALACGLAAMARDCATVRGIDTMVCSGGVLHNRLLAARLTFYLADFTLLFAQQLPAGDGAIAYGQAVIAAARGQAQGIQP